MLGGLLAIVHLRTRDRRWDMRSYVAIHMSLIFGVGDADHRLDLGRGAWGHWWVWSEPTLVSFLIIMLLYATYQPLRFAIEDPERQARSASVFAITAGAFVPLNYIAVRLSTAYLHPRVLGNTSNLPPSMAFTLLVALVAMALLFATLWLVSSSPPRGDAHAAEVAQPDTRVRGSSAAAHPNHAREAPAPDQHTRKRQRTRPMIAPLATALPENTGGGYVAAAYIVFFAIVLIYVTIMAVRLTRVERGLRELNERAERQRQDETRQDETQIKPRARDDEVDPARGRSRDARRGNQRPPMSELLALGISHKRHPSHCASAWRSPRPGGRVRRVGDRQRPRCARRS